MRTKRDHEEAMLHQNVAFHVLEHLSPEDIEAMRRPFLQPFCSKQAEATAPAGPRVSDADLALEASWWRQFSPDTVPVEGRAILDLADSRTALAAANARIAVLEAEPSERDIEVTVASITQNTHLSPEMIDQFLTMNRRELHVNEQAKEKAFRQYELSRLLVAAWERVATVSPEPAAPLPDSSTNGDPT